MTTLSINLPDSLHKKAKELASNGQMSINQLITTALAEKIAALTTDFYIENRAKSGDRKKFLNALSKVKDIPPEKYDEL
ncbi:MAG: toxin-antitoxin system HicB family antitoxin [Desulfamplus sp.]|nr:toxin-antitoxin system HicB family antitoxin [Desulfamplus sp.]